MTMSKSVMTIVAMSAIAFSANAKPKPAALPSAAYPPPPEVSVMSEEQYQKALKNAKSTTRRVADIDKVDEATALSDELKNIRGDIIGGPVWSNKLKTAQAKPGIKNTEGIVALINDLETRYESLPMDAKFVAAQIIALKPYRSIVYRARHLIDNAEFTKASVITALRMGATGQNVFFPTEQWKAGFDFLTAPSANMGADIKSEEDLQIFLRDEVLPALQTLRKRVYAMNSSTPIYFDNQMAYSAANFVSDDDRFALLGETERIAALSGLSFATSGMYTSLAYNWSGLFTTGDKVARIYGFRNGLSAYVPGLDFVDGMTAQKRNSIILKNESLFTLRPGGESWTRAAYPLFKEGVQYAKIAWSMAKKDGNSNSNVTNLIDPRGLLPVTRQTDTGIANIESLIEGDGLTSAIVGGEKVDVNFKEIFMNPPEDLKVFMPTKFDNGKTTLSSPYARDNSGNLKGGYRNYLQGSPTAWCVTDCKGADGKAAKSFGHYFPGVKSAEDVRRSARIMGQTWGGGLVGIPFSAIVF